MSINNKHYYYARTIMFILLFLLHTVSSFTMDTLLQDIKIDTTLDFMTNLSDPNIEPTLEPTSLLDSLDPTMEPTPITLLVDSLDPTMEPTTQLLDSLSPTLIDHTEVNGLYNTELVVIIVVGSFVGFMIIACLSYFIIYSILSSFCNNEINYKVEAEPKKPESDIESDHETSLEESRVVEAPL